MLPLFVFSDLPSLLFGSHNDPNLSPIRDVTDPEYSSSSFLVLRLLFANGVVHFAQNILAFSECSNFKPEEESGSRIDFWTRDRH